MSPRNPVVSAPGLRHLPVIRRADRPAAPPPCEVRGPLISSIERAGPLISNLRQRHGALYHPCACRKTDIANLIPNEAIWSQ